MKSRGFHLNGRYIDWKDIATARAESAFETQTLQFILEWQTGQKHFMLQTSGSTGLPKTLRVTREQLVASARQTIEALHLTARDVALCCLSTGFIAGKMMLVRAMMADMTLYANDPAASPLSSLDIQPTFTAVVPLQLGTMIPALGNNSSFRAILVGGAPLPSPLRQELKQVQVPVYETYGMTETVSHIALKRISGQAPDTLFRILPGIEIDQDQDKCLRIKGKVTGDQWISTRDIVALHPQGFEWLGRLDHVINTGGIKIHPERVETEIAEALEPLGLRNRFLLTSLPDDRLGQRLLLLIEGDPKIGKEELMEKLKSRLSKYHCPKEILYLPQFAETDSGKIQRQKTRELIRNRNSP